MTEKEIIPDEKEIANLVEQATRAIVGNRQTITQDEAKRITLLVAKIITDKGLPS